MMLKKQQITQLIDSALSVTAENFVDPDFRKKIDFEFGEFALTAFVKPHYYSDEGSLYFTVDFRTRTPNVCYSDQTLLGTFQYGKDSEDKDTILHVNFERLSLFLRNDNYSALQISNQSEFLEFQMLILGALATRNDEIYSFILENFKKAKNLKSA